MSVVRTYRSTDTNAPPLSAVAGSLDDVLRATLVDGYGSVFATGTVTSSGVLPTDGDTVTIGSKTYTFKTTLVAGNANQVLIGASAATALANLQAAVNQTGASGTAYTAVTLANADVWASAVSTTVLTLTARIGGTGGNSLALSKVAATLTVSGANLAGGSGSNTITAAGWTRPYAGNPGQAVYKGGSGVQHFYHFDDNLNQQGFGSVGKEAQFRGSETATGFQSAGGYFPTVAQIALGSGLAIRKSASADTVPRAWILVADDRSVILHVLTGDAANFYSIYFGEIYSLASTTDNFRSLVIGRGSVNSSANTSAAEPFGNGPGISAAANGHYMPRSYTGSGTALAVSKAVDAGIIPSTTMGAGVLAGSDPCSGQLLFNPVRVTETNVCVRGRLRGVSSPAHTASTFALNDTIVPTAGTYAGRTFIIVPIYGVGAVGNAAIDTSGPWETN